MLLFNDVSIFGSGGPFVKGSKMSCAILVEGNNGEYFCEVIFN